MDNLFFNKESKFKEETVSSVPIGGNRNIVLEKGNSNDLKKQEIDNNIKPMLVGNGNSVIIPSDNKKLKLNRKVPKDSFFTMANPKKNINGNTSSEGSDDSSSGSDDSESDGILSKQSGDKSYDDDSGSEESESGDDYSTINDDEESSSGSDGNSMTSNTYESTEEEDDEEDSTSGSSGDRPRPKKKSYEEIQQEKQQLLFNLERLHKQGYPPSKRYTMATSYEDMKFEYDRLKKQRDVEKSIKFSRKMLMACVSGIEFLNGKFDFFDIKLNGWSENVMENVSDYDEVFEELHDKYSDSVKMAPEMRLLMMVAGSGFMFHLTNSLFKSATPNLKDILKQNPDIMKNIQEAAAKNMTNNISSEFGENDEIGNMMKNGINMKMGQQPLPPRGPVGPARPSMMGGFPNSFMGGQPSSQPRMNGPSNDVDELLSKLSAPNDDVSVSSMGSSIRMRTSGKRKGKKAGIDLDI